MIRTHTWQLTPSGKFWTVDGDGNRCVSAYPDPCGQYLWVDGKKYGYEPDLAAAMMRVEVRMEGRSRGMLEFRRPACAPDASLKEKWR